MSDDIHENKQYRNIATVDTNSAGVRSPRQRRTVSTPVRGISLTRQADKDRACIHTILKKGQKTGLFPVRTAEPLQGYLPSVESFHDAMNVVVQAQQTFEGLPSNIRERFDNDPSKMLSFVSNPDNLQEMVSLGLADASTLASIEQGRDLPGGSPSAPQSAGEGETPPPQGE